MKRLSLLMLLVCVMLTSFSCTSESPEDAIEATTLVEAPQTKQIEIEILELINAYRLDLGLNNLRKMDDIKIEAYGHTNYMKATGSISHTNFYQRKQNLINNAGALNVGENVAYAYSSAQAVVNAWINSESHRENMEGDYTNFDISAEQDEDGRWYYTNIFVKK